MGFVQHTYSPGQRKRNRVIVVTTMIVGLLALIAAGVYWSWEPRFIVGRSAIWLTFGAVLYWIFASQSAGPIVLSENSKYRLRAQWGIRKR